MNKKYNITGEMDSLKGEAFRLRKKMTALEPDSDEYTKVFRHYIEIHEHLNEYAKTASEDLDKTFGRWIGLGVSLFTCSVPLIFRTGWFHEGLRFEETGSYCSQTLKWVLDNLRTK